MKAIKTILGIVGASSFLMLWGIVGGMEHNTMSLTQGTVLSMGFLAVTVLCLILNNRLEMLYCQKLERQNRRIERQKRNKGIAA